MNKPPMWFVVLAVLALLWNLLGCLAIGMDMSLSPEDVAGLPAEQQALHARPVWGIAASALAVLAGALGSLGLLLKKRWALPVLVASLIGIVVQDVDLFARGGAYTLAGPVVAGMQGFVLAVGIALVWLARKARARRWLS